MLPGSCDINLTIQSGLGFLLMLCLLYYTNMHLSESEAMNIPRRISIDSGGFEVGVGPQQVGGHNNKAEAN